MRLFAGLLLVASSLFTACGPPLALRPLETDPARRAPPGDEDLVNLVPGEAETVLAIDLEALRKSPWTKAMLAAAPPRSAHPRGFDEIGDVDRLVLAKIPSAGPGAPSLELLRGRFDEARVRAAFVARAGGLEERSIGGHLVMAARGEAVAFLSARTIAAGPERAVRLTVEVARGQRDAVRTRPWLAEAHAALEDEIGRRPGPGAIELALRMGEETRRQLGRELVGGETLDRVVGRIELGTAVDLTLIGVTAGREEATALARRWRAQLHRSRRVAEALGFAWMMERMTIEARGARLCARLTLVDGDRETLVQSFEHLGEAMAALRAESSGGAGAAKSATSTGTP